MTAKKKNQTPSYEELLQVIETKLEQLEAGDLALEKSLEAYEEGVKALRQCYGILKGAEGKVELLTKTIGDPELAEYDVESGSAKDQKPTEAAKPDTSRPAKDEGKSLF